MNEPDRESELFGMFIEMADTLVAGYDVADLLHRLVSRSARIFGVTDAGIHLRDGGGALHVAAVTSERGQRVSLLEIDTREGPCLDAFTTGKPVSADDAASIYARWPTFAVQAGESGYQSVHAIPMRLREDVIGSFNLFSDAPGPLGADDIVAARGLADTATIGILHERALRESHVVRTQLQHALDSRVLIEQAKGVLAQADGVDMDAAFRSLRHQARSSGRLLADVAKEVIDEAGRHREPPQRMP